MNNKVFVYFKKQPLLTFLSSTVVLLIVLVVINKLLTKPTEITPKVESISPPIITGITSNKQLPVPIRLSVSLPMIPEYLSAYEYEPIVFTLDILGGKLGLTPSKYPNRHTDMSQNQTLIYDSYSKRFEYANNQIPGHDDASLSQVIDLGKAIKATNSFVKNKLDISPATPLINFISYYSKNSEHGEPVDINIANVAEIPYTFLPEEKETYTGKEKNFPLYIYVDSADNIVGFRLYQTVFSTTNEIQVKTIDTKDIIKHLQEGKSTIIRRSANDTNQFNLEKIIDIEIKNINVEYRTTESGLVAPYFRISADAKQEGFPQPVVLDFIVLAIRSSDL